MGSYILHEIVPWHFWNRFGTKLKGGDQEQMGDLKFELSANLNKDHIKMICPDLDEKSLATRSDEYQSS